MRWRRLAALVAVVLIPACSSPPPPSASAGPDPSNQEAAQECAPIDLRAPSGHLVDLTGRWQVAGDGQFQLHQNGSCLYWFGWSDLPGTEPGTFWATVLYGTIHSDFTITGHWGDVQYQPTGVLNNGELVMRIDFEPFGDGDEPVIHATHATGGFGGNQWARAETISAAAEMDGVLGGNLDELFGTGCMWIESAGVRYLLLGLPDYGARGDGTVVRIIGPQGQVVAETGDALRINGRVAPLLGGDCTESAVIADSLQVP